VAGWENRKTEVRTSSQRVVAESGEEVLSESSSLET